MLSACCKIYALANITLDLRTSTKQILVIPEKCLNHLADVTNTRLPGGRKPNHCDSPSVQTGQSDRPRALTSIYGQRGRRWKKDR